MRPLHYSKQSTEKQAKYRKAMTRFLAYDDPTVMHTMFRDLDSRFSPRELMAVNEWLRSDFGFHAMRDHPEHTTEVLGGMFGMVRGVLDHHQGAKNNNTSMTDLIRKALREQPNGI